MAAGDRGVTHERNVRDALAAELGGVADVELMGGSDSTVSDVLVTPRDGGEPFYVECKECSVRDAAQGGQFVVRVDAGSGRVVYGTRNSDPVTPASQAIMDALTRQAGELEARDGKPVTADVPSEVAADWVFDHYSAKNARFIAVEDGVFVPLEDVGRAFDVRAICRPKKSGSGHVSPGKAEAAIEAVRSALGADATFSDVGGGKMGVRVPLDPSLAGSRIPYEGGELYVSDSRAADGFLEVRQLSPTKSMTVVMRLVLRPDYVPEGGAELVREECVRSSEAARRRRGGGRSGGDGGPYWVEPYVRSDGTMVSGHWRKARGSR